MLKISHTPTWYHTRAAPSSFLDNIWYNDEPASVRHHLCYALASSLKVMCRCMSSFCPSPGIPSYKLVPLMNGNYFGNNWKTGSCFKITPYYPDSDSLEIQACTLQCIQACIFQYRLFVEYWLPLGSAPEGDSFLGLVTLLSKQ